jgi:hypothetical protein
MEAHIPVPDPATNVLPFNNSMAPFPRTANMNAYILVVKQEGWS